LLLERIKPRVIPRGVNKAKTVINSINVALEVLALVKEIP
jgi:hypothetical protein